MFFRFGGAIILVVLVSLGGIALEKRNLALRRAVSHQQFRREVLLHQHARQRARTQHLGAPARLIEALETGRLTSPEAEGPARPGKSAETPQSTQDVSPASQ